MNLQSIILALILAAVLGAAVVRMWKRRGRGGCGCGCSGCDGCKKENVSKVNSSNAGKT